MPIFDHNPTKEDVAAASGLSEDKLDESLTQLVMLSLLNQEISTDEQGRVATAYSILPLTLSFAQSKLSENRGLEVAARKHLGFFLQRQQKEKEALEQYGYALERIGATTEKGKLAALQAQLAFAAYQRGNHDEATKLFIQAVEADPNLAYTYQLWAMVERQEGNVGKADELFREAARLNPTNPIVWRSWAMMKKELNDLDGSEKILRDGLRNRPNDKATVHSLAVVSSLKGEYEVADKLFEDAYTRNPSGFEDRKNNMYVFAARAENFRKWGENEERQKHYESAQDKCKKGLTQISEGLRFDPTEWNFIKNSIRLHASLARIESKLGNLDEAEYLFRSAIYFSPRNPQQRRHNSAVYLSRALNFAKMGKKEDAKKMCEENIRQAYNVKAANFLGELGGDFDRDHKEI